MLSISSTLAVSTTTSLSHRHTVNWDGLECFLTYPRRLTVSTSSAVTFSLQRPLTAPLKLRNTLQCTQSTFRLHRSYHGTNLSPSALSLKRFCSQVKSATAEGKLLTEKWYRSSVHYQITH